MDRTLEDTFYIAFTTRSFSTGAPATLSGTPVVSAYEDAGLTQITAGITLGVDHDAVTGLNMLTIVAAAASGYEAGKDYNLVITTGTVGGVSVVGEVVGTFSLGLDASYKRLGAPAGASVSADLADVPTVSEFNARTLVAANYFDPATDAVATVTTLSNLPAITANWLTSAGIAAGALDGKGNWNIGKTGYTLTQTFPANFSDFAITVTTGKVTAENVTLAAATHTGAVIPTVSTLTGHTPQTADHAANISAIVSAATEARMSELDAGTAGKMANQVDIIQTDTTTDIPATITTLQSDTDDIQAQIGTAGAGLTDLGGMSTTMKAQINTEVVDTLNTDTYAEPGQGAPLATTSLAAKINYLYKGWRNKSTQTASTYSLYDDAGTTVDQKVTVSDDATTATKGEVATGP